MSSESDLARSYALGAQDERKRVEREAAVDHEHAQAWARLGERASEARRQQLLRLFRACAEDFAERSGHAYVEYRGGPVVWR